jgi:choloylglycine hydrolase
MTRITLFSFLLIFSTNNSKACSIAYYIDEVSGNIFAGNNEDYWYDVKEYMQFNPAKDNKLAHLWYGWDKFAQGGINAKGLFFDAAVTPEQKIPEGYQNPNGRNVGADLLSVCDNVDEAIAYLEQEKIAVSNGHLFLGDANGNAVVIEWIKGEKKLITLQNNRLIATNYLLSDTTAGYYPCIRYQSIEKKMNELDKRKQTVDLRTFVNVMAVAVQIPQTNEEGKKGGTLYSTFVNLKTLELVVAPRMNNNKVMKFDLNTEFAKSKRQKIKLYK